MAKCHNCFKKLQPDFKLCPYCGTSIDESGTQQSHDVQHDTGWKQILLTDVRNGSHTEFFIVMILATAAAFTIKIPELFGFELLNDGDDFYLRNFSILSFPFVSGYFAWKRRIKIRGVIQISIFFVLAAAVVNFYPFTIYGSTSILATLHLPIALWIIVGFAYYGGQWSLVTGSMDFIRFSGELFIYYVLIALGGGVFTALTVMLFSVIDLNLDWIATSWIIPCGAVGAIIIGSWIVEWKQKIIENVAPILAKTFTPLFAIMLIVFIGTMLFSLKVIEIEREVLIGFNFLLIIVLGILIYNVSARDSESPPGIFDILQLILISSALVIDTLVLIAILNRISEFGISPNKIAAVVENLIIFINLSFSAWLYLQFIMHRCLFSAVEKWQTKYIPVYASWAAMVVLVFPPAFGYI